MKNRIGSLNHEFISPIEVEDKQDATTSKEDFRTGLGQTTQTEEGQGMGKGRLRYDSNYKGSYGHNMRGNQR